MLLPIKSICYIQKLKKQMSFEVSCLLYTISISQFWIFYLCLWKNSLPFKKKLILNYVYGLQMCVPSIVIYNIVVLSFVSLIKVVKPFNVSYVSLCKKKTMYTLLRSPFVDKKSREQMLVNNFVGVLNIKVGIKHILLFEYFEFFLKDLVLSIVYTKCCILKNIYIL